VARRGARTDIRGEPAQDAIAAMPGRPPSVSHDEPAGAGAPGRSADPPGGATTGTVSFAAGCRLAARRRTAA